MMRVIFGRPHLLINHVDLRWLRRKRKLNLVVLMVVMMMMKVISGIHPTRYLLVVVHHHQMMVKKVTKFHFHPNLLHPTSMAPNPITLHHHMKITQYPKKQNPNPIDLEEKDPKNELSMVKNQVHLFPRMKQERLFLKMMKMYQKNKILDHHHLLNIIQ